MKTFVKKQFPISRNLKFLGCLRRFFIALVTSALLLGAASPQAATLTVTSGNDSGPGTLRQAILNASLSGGDTINFAMGITTINVVSGELVIDRSLTINGPGANLLAVRGAGSFRIFDIPFAFASVTATISGLTISGGSVSNDSGGGISNHGTMTIVNCTISGNRTVWINNTIYGGGISNQGLLTITNSTISGNSSGDGGGFAYGGGLANFGTAIVTKCTISANSAAQGGGSASNFGGTMTVTNSTVSGNPCGGIVTQMNFSPGSTTISNCTISGNSGGIGNFTGNSTTIRNSITALNNGADVSGTLTSQNFNLIGNNAGATITPAQPADQIGTPGSPIDPLLGPLQNNGGATQTQALLSGSPAIDKGNSSGLSTDQRGFHRPVDLPSIPNAIGGDGSDIGAFEFGSFAAPAVTTNPATNVASFSATLNGSVNPLGSITTVHFQYGTTTSYGFTTPVQTLTGNTVRPIGANINGLTASTVYHFRIVASNPAGTSFGSDRTFTTLPPTGPPVVTTNPTTLIASFSATLNGSLDPHGLITSVHFQYGTTTSYGLTTAPQSQSGNTYRNVGANIGSLTANTIYHFRMVASNANGTRMGADRTFTTLTMTGPPVVITNPASNITTSSATLNGSLDPHGLSTTVQFQYGTTTSYGHTTSIQTQTGSTYRNIAANISGLTTHMTYHFRIAATNIGGTRFGGDRTFTTP